MIPALFLSFAAFAQDERCLVGERYGGKHVEVVSARLSATAIQFSGSDAPGTQTLRLDGGRFVSPAGTGLPTTDGGIYWEFSGGVPAVLYPVPCGSTTPPDRAVTASLRFADRKPPKDDWDPFMPALEAVVGRGQVDAVIEGKKDAKATDLDYLIEADDLHLNVKSSGGTYEVTASFRLRASRTAHTTDGPRTFPIGEHKFSGDTGGLQTSDKAAMIRKAENDAMAGVGQWLHQYAELGLHVRMLEVSPGGARLSWARRDGVSVGQRYEVFHGSKRMGTLRVASASVDADDSRAVWERRKVGSPGDLAADLRPVRPTTFIFGGFGGVGMGAQTNRAVELFAGAQFAIGAPMLTIDASLGIAPFGGGDSAYVAGNLHLMLPVLGMSFGPGVSFVGATQTHVYTPGVGAEWLAPLGKLVSFGVRTRYCPLTQDLQLMAGFTNQ